jgi:hypothetical protein
MTLTRDAPLCANQHQPDDKAPAWAIPLSRSYLSYFECSHLICNKKLALRRKISARVN